MSIAFSKYEGLGNDFIIVDGRTADVGSARARAQALCDRHRGIGADGVLLVTYRAGQPHMQVVNADGSQPEMCGNGLRCVALHAASSASMVGRFAVATDAGPHLCEVRDDGQVTVEMVAASLAPAQVPVQAERPMIDAPFEIADAILHVTAVSMGNPHAVTFDVSDADRLTLGPAIGQDPRFPAGVNVGFARPDGTQRFVLHVLERGVGWTEACGTGACAAAVAAVETGRATRGAPIEIELPGGPLQILVGSPEARILMTGPARHVFDGVYPG